MSYVDNYMTDDKGVRWVKLNHANASIHQNADDKIQKLEKQLAESVLSRQQSYKAIKLFDSEYVGQNQDELWDWAVKVSLSYVITTKEE